MKQLPIRQIIFGLEDSLVSTLGVVVGIAAGTNDRSVVMLSAVVVIVVESLSMTAGTYLSDKSEMEMRHVHNVSPTQKAAINSIFMAISYIFGGLISVFPFLFLSPAAAILPSVIVSVFALFIIGYSKGKLVGVNALRSGLEMSLVSLAAALLGYLVGALAAPFIV